MVRTMAYPNLSAEMVRKGYTAEVLAGALGVHVSGVYLMLRGERKLSITKAKLLRDKLFPGQPLEYLFDPAQPGQG